MFQFQEFGRIEATSAVWKDILNSIMEVLELEGCCRFREHKFSELQEGKQIEKSPNNGKPIRDESGELCQFAHQAFDAQYLSNIKEIAIKTIPSASKIEIKRVLESLYGFEVEKVQTLNMEGKKWKKGWLLMAKPDYKKAYITVKHLLSISPDLYPIRLIEENKTSSGKKGKSSIVEESEKKKHWLEMKDEDSIKQEKGSGERSRGTGSNHAKFPWSYMRSGSAR